METLFSPPRNLRNKRTCKWYLASALLLAAPILSAEPATRSVPINWLEVPAPRLLQTFPSLRTFGYTDIAQLQVLRSVLAHAGLGTEAFARLGSEEEQASHVRFAVSEYARLRTSPSYRISRPGKSPTEELIDLDDRRRQVRDLLAVSQVIAEEERADLTKRLEAADKDLSRRLWALSERLIGRALGGAAAPPPGEETVVPLEDGTALALKHAASKDRRELEAGLQSMRGAARVLERAVPIALENKDGGFSRAAPQGVFMAYLLPKGIAADYPFRLGERLPPSIPPMWRKARIEDAALQAIKDMAILQREGYVHPALTPLSLSENPWRWDHWRWSASFLLRERFGPEALAGWKDAFAPANARLSGLSGLEHVVRIDRLDSRAGESFGHVVGRGLTQWAVLVMLACQRNGIVENDQITEILLKGFARHEELTLGRSHLSDEAELKRALGAAVWRFQIFQGVESLFPGFLIRILNLILDPFLGSPVASGVSLPMLGETLDALVMDVVAPYVQALEGGSPDFRSQYEMVESEKVHAARPWYSHLGFILQAFFPNIVLAAAFVGRTSFFSGAVGVFATAAFLCFLFRGGDAVLGYFKRGSWRPWIVRKG